MSRPRDRLGRPLPGDAPEADRAPEVPSIEGLTDSQVWELALTCLEQGLPFHAHEVCEERWRTCPPEDRPTWRALAQWGAAEVHAARGNDEGARRLAERALAGLPADPTPMTASSVQQVRERCRSLISAARRTDEGAERPH
jgi:hypothetical protein